MIDAVAVFIGGGLGAVLRWRCQVLLNNPESWPWGTFAVNLVGGFLAGLCLAMSSRLTSEMRLFVVTGVLGGLTTFSALSAEVVAMALRGTMIHAAAYGLGSLSLGILACWCGYVVLR